MKKIWIGNKTLGVCSEQETIETIKELIFNYKLDVYDNDDVVVWSCMLNKDFEDYDTLIATSIISERKKLDNNEEIDGLPTFGIVTAEEDIIKRIEFYEGVNSYEKTYDLRCKEWENEELDPSYDWLTHYKKEL